MTRKQQHPSPRSHHPRNAISWLMVLAFTSAVLLDIACASSVSTVDLNTKTESVSLSSENPPESWFRLKFLQNPNAENSAAVSKKGELYLRHRDNEEDNNDREGLRYRREDVSPPAEGGKVITTNWGTYEEQAPVVIESASRTLDPEADDEEPTFSDGVQSRESADEYGSPAGVGSISYEEYEDGHFEGRQFYPSRGGGYKSAEEQEQPDGYYRQKYYATTPPSQEDGLNQGEESKNGVANRPRFPNRYRTPPQRKEEEDSQGIMGFVQKAKTFYDIFRAMNSAWKSIEDRYRKNGEGIFLGEPQLNETTTTSSTEKPLTSGKTTKNPRPKAKKRRTTTTKAPPTNADVDEDEEEGGEEQQQAKDEYRSRRSSLDEAAVTGQATATTSSPETESSSDAELESDSDLESSESDSTSPSSTAVAEGRYIKGDPLKGYYDFVITEGSYKFWAVFQVGTALLIIYSTFAAIYYSKVNPLVSDYDYIDYLGGGRSLSDDSDFVDTDAPASATGDDDATATASKTGKRPTPGGMPRSQRQKQSSAGWFDWVPHAGHTLRFILEAIDKGYNEEE